MSGKHTHTDSKGRIHTCYHSCKTALLSWGFWVGLTLGFPLEHLLWERIWPFNILTKLLGL